MFNRLKQEYEQKYGVSLDFNAGNRLSELQTSLLSETRTSEIMSGTAVNDLLTSLIFSRSCDVTLTRTTVFGSQTENVMTKADVEYAILSMPCKCPVKYKCCEKMTVNNINNVVVFAQDSEMLQNQGVSTITDLQNMSQERMYERSENKFMMGLGRADDLSKFENLLKSKIEMWKKTAAEIAAPLVGFYHGS